MAKMMLDPKKINEMVSEILDSLPPGLKNLPKDIQKNLHNAMTNVFAKMDLVTREEFDAQVKVLERTRQKLEQLETQITQLEKKDK